MKPGDIVRLAPNMFNDPKTCAYKMLVIDTFVDEDLGYVAVCLVDGSVKKFQQAMLDVMISY